MKRNQGKELVSRQRRARDATRHADSGLGLVEIMVAFAVFMICFVPLMQLLPQSAAVITQNTNRNMATAVVNSTLLNDQSQLSVNGNAPTFDPVNANKPASWGSAVRTASSQNGSNFEIYTLSGWCRTQAAPGNGTVLATDQPTYHVVVKVGWGKNLTNSSTTNVVVDSTEIPATVSSAPSVGTTVYECPLGLA